MKIWLAWGLQSLDISAANHPAVQLVMVLKVTMISWKLGLACEAEDTAYVTCLTVICTHKNLETVYVSLHRCSESSQQIVSYPSLAEVFSF